MYMNMCIVMNMNIVIWILKLPFKIVITPALLCIGGVGWIMYDDTDTLKELLGDLWA